MYIHGLAISWIIDTAFAASPAGRLSLARPPSSPGPPRPRGSGHAPSPASRVARSADGMHNRLHVETTWVHGRTREGLAGNPVQPQPSVSNSWSLYIPVANSEYVASRKSQWERLLLRSAWVLLSSSSVLEKERPWNLPQLGTWVPRCPWGMKCVTWPPRKNKENVS